jgi:hypothetical protein
MSLYMAQPYAMGRNKGTEHASGRACHATSRKNVQHHATHWSIPVAERQKQKFL